MLITLTKRQKTKLITIITDIIRAIVIVAMFAWILSLTILPFAYEAMKAGAS